MLCLLHHPEYQRKIQQELDSVIGRDRLPQISDRGKCPFIEAVVMEAMRYITPVPFLLPHVCTEDVKFEGYYIAKKSLVRMVKWVDSGVLLNPVYATTTIITTSNYCQLLLLAAIVYSVTILYHFFIFFNSKCAFHYCRCTF